MPNILSAAVMLSFQEKRLSAPLCLLICSTNLARSRRWLSTQAGVLGRSQEVAQHRRRAFEEARV